MRTPSTKRILNQLWVAALGASLVGSIAVGCGNKGEERSGSVGPAPGGFGGLPERNELVIGRCEGDESVEQECKVYIDQANGKRSCFTGFQYCSDGVWSDCLDPTHDPRVQ
jgi:hypothetical protein